MSNPIKEYLVSIGLDLNKTKLQQTQKGIKDTTNLIDKMKQASDFLKRGLNGLTLSMLGLAGASAQLVTSLAKQDQKFETLAQRMFVSRQSVYEYQSAVKALGVTIDEIQFNPTLMKQYKELVSDSRKMFVGKEYQGAMTTIRSFLFEFVRLKQESMYLLQWIGFSIIKNLQIPLEKARLTLQGLNDFIVKNMSKIGDTIGKMIFNVKNFSKSIMDFFGNIIKEVQQFWSSLPPWAKKFIMGTGVIGAIFIGMQNPIIFVSALITGILLLIDDFQKHINNKKSQFGEFWDKLITWIDKTKTTIYEWKDKSIKWIEDVYSKVKNWLEGIKQKVNENLPKWKSEFKSFCSTVSDGFNTAVKAVKSFLNQMDRLEFFWGMVSRHGLIYTMGRVFSGKFEQDFQEYKNEKNANQKIANAKRNFDSLSQQEQEALIQSYKKANNPLGAKLDYYRKTGKNFPGTTYVYQMDREVGIPEEVQSYGNIPAPPKTNSKIDKYDSIINAAATKYGVSQNLIKAVIAKETGGQFNADAHNKNSGASGLMQLTPITQKHLGVKDPFNAQENIFAGTRYLKELLARYNGDVKLALIAYNYGPSYADDFYKNGWSDKDLPTETMDYYKSILSYMKNGQYRFNKNAVSTSVGSKVTPIKQKANDTCGVVSVAMANNAINGNNNLNEDNILSTYGYSLLSALNGTNKNKNIKWKDLGNKYISDKELNEIIKANQRGLPAIAGVAGDFKWGYSQGHFFVITKSDVKQRKLTIVDPATGETYQKSFDWLKNAPQRSDGYGNAVFIPYQLQQQKQAQKSKQIQAPQQTKFSNADRVNQTITFNMDEKERKQGLIRGWWNGVGNWATKRWNEINPFVNNNNIKDLQGSTGQYHSNISSPMYVGGINITVNTNSNDPNAIGVAVANNLESRMNYFALNRGLGLGAV